MKVAARFPVKDCFPLKWAILVTHLLLIVIALFYLVGWIWVIAGVTSTLISYYFSISHYKSITSAEDDLCWSGDSWQMQTADLTHFQLLPTSWLSNFASLLHLKEGDKTHYWLFTKYNLGDRAFRELNYIARQDLVNQRSNSDKA